MGKKLVRFIREIELDGHIYQAVVTKDGELDRGFKDEAELQEYVALLKLIDVKVTDERVQ